MSTVPTGPFTCPKTNEACLTADLCQVATAPLIGVVDQLRENAPSGPGKSAPYVAAVVRRELEHFGDTLGHDLSVQVDYRDASLCPESLINRTITASGRGASMTGEQIALGVSSLLGNLAKGIQRSLAVDSQRRERRRP